MLLILFSWFDESVALCVAHPAAKSPVPDTPKLAPAAASAVRRLDFVR